MAAVTVVTAVGIPGLAPLPITVTLLVMSLSALFTFIINDSVKVTLVKNAKISW